MTWTQEDTEALRELEPCGGFVGCHPERQDYTSACDLRDRAADEIERLRACVADLERINEEQARRIGNQANTLKDTSKAVGYWKRQAIESGRCLRERRKCIATLESERAEVARELHKIAGRAEETDDPFVGELIEKIATSLEQKEDKKC